MKERLLTIEQAAEKLDRSPNTLRTWRRNKTGPRCARLGRRLAYLESDLDAWVASQFEEQAG